MRFEHYYKPMRSVNQISHNQVAWTAQPYRAIRRSVANALLRLVAMMQPRKGDSVQTRRVDHSTRR